MNANIIKTQIFHRIEGHNCLPFYLKVYHFFDALKIELIKNLWDANI